MFRIAAAVTSMNSQAWERLIVFYYSFNTLFMEQSHFASEYAMKGKKCMKSGLKLL